MEIPVHRQVVSVTDVEEKVHFAKDVQYPGRENMHKSVLKFNISQMIIDSIVNVIGQAL